jgi:hypothetical protein
MDQQFSAQLRGKLAMFCALLEFRSNRASTGAGGV